MRYPASFFLPPLYAPHIIPFSETDRLGQASNPAKGECMRALWGVAMLAVWAGHGQERQPGQGVNFYTKDQEIALGRQLGEEYRQKTTPLDNPAVRDYVRRLGARLAAQFPGWQFQIEPVREDQGGATREPAAFPGGMIFVSVDLLAASRNEAEFAGMLAHAMAHVAARHGTRLATKNQLMSPNSAGATPDSVPLSMLAFQRAAEREADDLAVKAMSAAGFDPAGLASYLQTVHPSPRAGISAKFATLPPPDQRVTAIQAEIRKLPARLYETNDEFARVQASLKTP